MNVSVGSVNSSWLFGEYSIKRPSPKAIVKWCYDTEIANIWMWSVQKQTYNYNSTLNFYQCSIILKMQVKGEQPHWFGRSTINTDLSCAWHERGTEWESAIVKVNPVLVHTRPHRPQPQLPSPLGLPRCLLTITWIGHDWLLVLCHDPLLLMLLKK